MNKLHFWRQAVTVVLALLLSAPAWPQGGGKSLRMVVPFAAGGAQDVIGRYLGNQLAGRLGQTVVIENRAGAGGAISIASHLNPKLPNDPKKDFAAVALVGDTPMTIVVRADSPCQTLADVLRDARA